MSTSRIDKIDRKILEYLSEDARISNREIASAMDLTEGTVRGRIKRLQSENIIRIMAIADVRVQTGYDSPMMAYLGIHADLKEIKGVADAIAKLPFVRFAATMLGRYDILDIFDKRKEQEADQEEEASGEAEDKCRVTRVGYL